MSVSHLLRISGPEVEGGRGTIIGMLEEPPARLSIQILRFPALRFFFIYYLFLHGYSVFSSYDVFSCLITQFFFIECGLLHSFFSLYSGSACNSVFSYTVVCCKVAQFLYQVVWWPVIRDCSIPLPLTYICFSIPGHRADFEAIWPLKRDCSTRWPLFRYCSRKKKMFWFTEKYTGGGGGLQKNMR
jgi:hypothetical protein